MQPDASGITITSRGRLAAPINLMTRRAEVRYRSDWTPEFLLLDTDVGGGDTAVKTTFGGDAAISEGTVRGQAVSYRETVSRTPFVLPSLFFGSYAAVARRLTASDIGSVHRAFVAPQSPELTFRLNSVSMERMQTGTSAFNVRRFVLMFPNPAGVVAVNVFADDSGNLLRVNLPSQGLDVVRDDLASSTGRTLVYSNPSDEAVTIPATGFNIGATVTRPSAVTARLAAVVLLGAPDVDRDGTVAGVAILGQLAGAVADAGLLAVRYDPRGRGQSGGRVESATLGDYADDARAIVRWLAQRPYVDKDRIAVLGHGQAAWIALLAAARDKRIAAVAAIAAPASTGAELVLEQQLRTLEEMKAPATDRDAKVALQKQINAAVISGRGWEDIPAEIRSRADTPWFQSLLTFNPADTLEDVRQPMLFVHGQLDRQISVAHLDRIAEIARQRSDSKSVSAISVRGVNHLLVPATTGEPAEYAALPDKNIGKDVKTAITDWLASTFAKIR